MLTSGGDGDDVSAGGERQVANDKGRGAGGGGHVACGRWRVATMAGDGGGYTGGRLLLRRRRLRGAAVACRGHRLRHHVSNAPLRRLQHTMDIVHVLITCSISLVQKYTASINNNRI